ncbi:BLUF domain-containing protein [Actinoplanes sp. TFC3]|uniref:BLUF domain-containing protein n=1 Tax=Actinoplanes sp. TFC3 TaxID=1710355 RepID=UPI0008358935|nr:BLUF domain-containing protein [Actinoplanes sp. TFC3]
MGLNQLIYSSVKSDALRPDSMFGIRDQARTNNARHDVTGVLLFNREHFVQCLEGERDVVTRTFCTISGDDRHQQVALMSVRDIEERSFPDWSMGLIDAESPSIRAAVGDMLPSSGFEPGELSARTTIVMMQRLRTLKISY